MIKKIYSKKIAESLVGIIVGVFILSFVLLGIGNLIGNSREMISSFNEKMEIDILSKNAGSIVNNLDLSIVSDGDIFYIHKNTSSGSFDIYIGEHNREYKYIDSYGNKIDNPSTYNSSIIYTRIFQTKTLNINGEQKTAVKVLVKKLIK